MIVATYSVFCDSDEGCDKWVGSESTPKEARAAALRAGWLVTQRTAHCPKHRRVALGLDFIADPEPV